MVGLGLVQGFFGVGLGVILGWFKIYVGLVSGVYKVGLVIYFWLVQGSFRIYVGLLCGLFGFAYDFLGLVRCLFNKCSLGFIYGWIMSF